MSVSPRPNLFFSSARSDASSASLAALVVLSSSVTLISLDPWATATVRLLRLGLFSFSFSFSPPPHRTRSKLQKAALAAWLRTMGLAQLESCASTTSSRAAFCCRTARSGAWLGIAESSRSMSPSLASTFSPPDRSSVRRNAARARSVCPRRAQQRPTPSRTVASQSGLARSTVS